MMWSFALITLAGVLGSSHCLGMCGGFALMLGMGYGSSWRNFQGQLVYSAGRIASYTTLGGIAGYAGKWLAERAPTMLNVPALLCVISGLFLVWQGLLATGLLRRQQAVPTSSGCLFGSLFSTLLKHPALRNAFAAGIFTGLLPCGLVYSFVSLAASSGDMLHGAGIMLAFGLGTVPLMVLAGVGGTLLGIATRQRLWQAAAWSVVVTGLLTLGRGAAFLQPSKKSPAERCPLCTAAETNRVPSLSLPSLKNHR